VTIGKGKMGVGLLTQKKSTVSIHENAFNDGVCAIVDTGRIHHTILFVEFAHLSKFQESNFKDPAERSKQWKELIEKHTVTRYLTNHAWHIARGDKNNATKARSLLKVANMTEIPKTEETTPLPVLPLNAYMLSRSKTSVFQTSVNYSRDHIGDPKLTNNTTSSMITNASFRTAQHIKSTIVQDLKDVVAECFENKKLHAVFWYVWFDSSVQ
jgi:hypothetical protein